MKNLLHRNVRDIGGNYKDVSIRTNMLIRGKSIARFNDEEVEYLKNHYYVRTIIDLRSSEEANALNKYKKEFNFYSQPVFEGLVPGLSHQEVTFENLHEVIPEMDKLYYLILHDEPLKNLASTVKFILNLPEDDYAIYFHCAEGKDRTGLLAAILLLILGVDEAEIVEDYLFTNRVNKKKAFRYYLVMKYIKRRRALAYKLRRIYVAKREYINVLFDVIRDEYGSNDNFFYHGLHLSKEEIDKFREMMIVRK